MDLVSRNPSRILDFVPLGRTELVTLSENSLVTLYNFNSLNYKKISEFDLKTLEANSDDLEVATVSICQRNQYVVVSAHNHLTGSKRRLYLFKIDHKMRFKLLTIKEYGKDEPMRNTYLSVNIDFYVDDYPLVTCYEHSASGNVVSYLIKNDRFELFQVFDKFMSHYCFNTTLFENKLWSIDNAGKLRCLELVRKYGEIRTDTRSVHRDGDRSQLSSLRKWETNSSVVPVTTGRVRALKNRKTSMPQFF